MPPVFSLLSLLSLLSLFPLLSLLSRLSLLSLLYLLSLLSLSSSLSSLFSLSSLSSVCLLALSSLFSFFLSLLSTLFLRFGDQFGTFPGPFWSLIRAIWGYFLPLGALVGPLGRPRAPTVPPRLALALFRDVLDHFWATFLRQFWVPKSMCFRDLVLGLLRCRFGSILAPISDPKTFVLFYGDLAVDKMRKVWIYDPCKDFNDFSKSRR